MSKALTMKERASRHRIMARLRSWIAKHELGRSSIAAQFGITPGHLRTLLNSNRTASDAQCQEAEALMDAEPLWGVSPKDAIESITPAKKAKPKRVKPKAIRKPNKLRPLTKAEGNFVKEVAEAWLNSHPKSSPDEYIEIVWALGIGIRS